MSGLGTSTVTPHAVGTDDCRSAGPTLAVTLADCVVEGAPSAARTCPREATEPAGVSNLIGSIADAAIGQAQRRPRRDRPDADRCGRDAVEGTPGCEGHGRRVDRRGTRIRRRHRTPLWYLVDPAGVGTPLPADHFNVIDGEAPSPNGRDLQQFTADTVGWSARLIEPFPIRSETADPFIADSVVGSGRGRPEFGSLAPGERFATYNRLLDVADAGATPPSALR